MEPNSRVLSLAAIKVDGIAQLRPNNCYASLDDDVLFGSESIRPSDVKWLIWHDETHRLAMQGPSDSNPVKPNQTRLEALWRTLAGDVTPATRPAPAILGFDYQAWIERLNIMKPYCSQAASTLPLKNSAQSQISDSASSWSSAMAQCAGGRRLCIKNGYMGMVPPLCETTDVCSILGAETPYIIPLSRSDGAFYELVGECYVRHIIDGR